MKLPESLDIPAYLISKEINYIEKIKDPTLLKTAPLLTVKRKSLIDCYVLEATGVLYKISDVKSLGKVKNKKWYDFTFGNHAIEIEVYVDEITDTEIIRHCMELTEFVKEIDAYSVDHEK